MDSQMLVRRIVFVVRLFGRTIIGTLGPIHSVSVTFFRSSGHDTNIFFIPHPPFETMEFNLIRTHEECLVEDFCYFFSMHPNTTKPSQLWCCRSLNTQIARKNFRVAFPDTLQLFEDSP